jgi:hypothetical protein
VTDLDQALRAFVRDRWVPIFAIVPAEAVGEEREVWRPTDILPGCRSIVLAGVLFVPFPYRVDPETNVADQAWWDANEPAFSAISRVRGKYEGGLDGQALCPGDGQSSGRSVHSYLCQLWFRHGV